MIFEISLFFFIRTLFLLGEIALDSKVGDVVLTVRFSPSLSAYVVSVVAYVVFKYKTFKCFAQTDCTR